MSELPKDFPSNLKGQGKIGSQEEIDISTGKTDPKMDIGNAIRKGMIETQGPTRNLSLISPESLISPGFLKEGISNEMLQNGEDNEKQWLESIDRFIDRLQKEIDSLSKDAETTESKQLLKKIRMVELMKKMIEKKKTTGIFCLSFGLAESSGVLLLTPIRKLGEKTLSQDDEKEEEQQTSKHIYVFLTPDGFYSLRFNKTVAAESATELYEKYGQSYGGVTIESMDERYPDFSEQALAWSSKEILFPEKNILKDAQNYENERLQKGEIKSFELENYVKDLVASKLRAIGSFNVNEGKLRIGNYTWQSEGQVAHISPLSTGDEDVDLIKKAVENSIKNAEELTPFLPTQLDLELELIDKITSFI